MVVFSTISHNPGKLSFIYPHLVFQASGTTMVRDGLFGMPKDLGSKGTEGIRVRW